MNKNFKHTIYFLGVTSIYIVAAEIAARAASLILNTRSDNLSIENLLLQTLIIIIYIWFLSKKIELFSNIWILITNFSIKETNIWVLIGAITPILSTLCVCTIYRDACVVENFFNIGDMFKQYTYQIIAFIPAAIFEEIMQRGIILFCVMRIFKNFENKIFISICTESLIFGLLHNYVGLIDFSRFFIFSSLCCLITIRFNSLMPSIGFHASVNIISNLLKGDSTTNGVLQLQSNSYKAFEICLYLFILLIAYQLPRNKEE